MPRLEIVPSDWETTEEHASGDGTPTVDLCTACASARPEGTLLSSTESDKFHVPIGRVVNYFVDHPDFTPELDYHCEWCGQLLTEEDDG